MPLLNREEIIILLMLLEGLHKICFSPKAAAAAGVELYEFF
jgi:hypothetical protein